MTDIKNDVQAEPADNVKDEALKTIREDLKSLQIQRKSYRNRLIKF